MHDKRNTKPLKNAKMRKNFVPAEIRSRNEFSWQEEKASGITAFDLFIGFVILAATLVAAVQFS